MQMTDSQRAEVRQNVLSLLARLEQIHCAAGGEITVSEVFEVIGQPSDRALRRDLEARGCLTFEHADGGVRFSNVGPAFKTKLGPGTLQVPGQLAGRLVRNGDGFWLEFDQDKTMIGKALLLELKLQRLEVSPRHVAIRLPGGLFDHEYTL